MKHGKGNSDRFKHIKIRNFWITDQINLGEVVLVRMRTENMISDLLTKPITGERFLKLRKILLNCNDSAQENPLMLCYDDIDVNLEIVIENVV